MSSPPSSNPALERQAITQLLSLYRTALRQEDIDRLQELLQLEEAQPQACTSSLPVVLRQEDEPWMNVERFCGAIAEAFRTLIFADLFIPADRIHITADLRSVSFFEIQSVADPRTFVQRSLAFRTTFQLAREEREAITTFRITAVRRDGPVVQVTTPGQVVAGALTRVIVTAPTEALTLRRVEVTIPETETAEVLVAHDTGFHGTFRAPIHASPEPLQVRLRDHRGEEILLPHRYRLRVPGEGVVQQVGATDTPFFAVTIAPDETVWFGGVAERPETIGTIVQVDADTATIMRTAYPGSNQIPGEAVSRIEDVIFDARGRLHAIFVAQDSDENVVGNGDIVLDLAYPERFCQTVNVFAEDYPFQVRDLRTGERRRSPSTRAVAAGEGDIWLFGSDGGVGRVTDTFLGGRCTPESVEVRYSGMFQRLEEQRAGAGLLSNTVSTLVVGAGGPRWFGTALGVTRLEAGQFTPILFSPTLTLAGSAETKEGLIREVAAAIFDARPLTTLAIGDVSFVDAFGRGLVKEDLIFSAVEDARGRLWVSTLGGGIRRIEAREGTLRDTLHLLRTQEVVHIDPATNQRTVLSHLGLSSNIVFALAVGPGHTIWAATDEGVSHIRESAGEVLVTTFSALDGLAQPVRDVVVDRHGTVWLATAAGLFQITSQGGRVEGVVRDAMNRPVGGVDVMVLGTPFRVVTDAEGRFSLGNLPLGLQHLQFDSRLAIGGPFTPTERAIEVRVGSQTLDVVVPPAETRQLVRVAGDGQTGVIATPLARPLVAAVTDAQSHPVPGIPVRFTIRVGAGTLFPSTGVTDTAGRVTTTLTITAAGDLAVEATGDGLGTVAFTAHGIEAADVSLIVVSGDNQVIAPGAVLPAPLLVRLEDQFGRPLVGEIVTAEIIEGDGELLRQVDEGPARFVMTATDAQGQARFFLQAGPSRGNIITRVSARGQAVPFLTVVGLVRPLGIAVEPTDHLVLVDTTLRAVVRVNPDTGDSTLVSGRGRGNGPSLTAPHAIAVEANGHLIVIDGDIAVLRVDPATGHRSLVSGVHALTGEQRGHGPDFLILEGIAVEQTTGHLFMVDNNPDSLFARVVRVDQNTGARTIISECREVALSLADCVGDRKGDGPRFAFPESIAVEATGQLVLVDAFFGIVMRVDPITGDRTILSGCTEFDAQFDCVARRGNGPLLLSPLDLAVEPDGHVIVADSDLNAVVRVNPATGRRTTVSGVISGTTESRGSGPNFQNLTGITVAEATGRLFVVDTDLDAVLRVEPRNGNRTIVSQAPRIGSGPLLGLPTDIAASGNTALVVDADLKAVMRVDPATGFRRIISGCRDRACADPVGPGPLFQSPAGLAITAAGNLVVADLERQAVVQVNPTTGQRTIVPGGTAAAPCLGRSGRSLLLSAPVDIAVERSTGHLVVVDIGHAAVLRVGTGDCTIIADGTIGSGPILQFPVGIAIEIDGHLVVADRGLQAVLRIDPVTGNRLPVSAPDTGIGPLLQGLSGLTIEMDGHFVVGDTIGSALIRIDPATGDRRVISHVAPFGDGPPLGFPRGITVETEDHLVLVDAALNAVVRVNAVTGDRTIISR